MKYTKLYYYKPKTVKSIAFINYTKLYCRKTSFFTKTIMLILTTCILTGLKLEVACLKSDNLKKKDRMILWEKENEKSYDFHKSKVHINERKKESRDINRLIDSTRGQSSHEINTERYYASLWRTIAANFSSDEYCIVYEASLLSTKNHYQILSRGVPVLINIISRYNLNVYNK